MTRSTGRSGASSPSIHRRHSRRACGHGLRTSRRRPCGGPTGSGRRSGRRRRWCSPWPCSGRRRRTRRSSRPPWSPRPGTQRLRRPAPYACGRNGPPPIDRSRSPPSRLSRPEGGSPAHFRQRQRPGPPRFTRVVFSEGELGALRQLLTLARDQPIVFPVSAGARTPFAAGDPPAELVIPPIAIEPAVELAIPSITIEPLNLTLLKTGEGE